MLLTLLLIMTALFFYSAYQFIFMFSNKDNKKHAKRFFVSLFVFVVLIFVYSAIDNNNDSSSEPKTEKTENKKETTKEKADKKEAKEVADTKKKNLAKNLEDYKNDLADVPTKTNGVVSSASIDPDNGETIVVLSDDALQGNGQQMQEVAHSAWNTIHGMGENYKLSENPDTHANLIEIKDQAGDKIATTSITGNFKYKGMK